MLQKKSVKKQKGLTLIEVIIAILLIVIIIWGSGGILSLHYGNNKLIKENYDVSCIFWALNSALEACKGGSPLSEFNCNGKKIVVNLKGNCTPLPKTCSTIEVSYQNKKTNIKLIDKVCNFGL